MGEFKPDEIFGILEKLFVTGLEFEKVAEDDVPLLRVELIVFGGEVPIGELIPFEEEEETLDDGEYLDGNELDGLEGEADPLLEDMRLANQSGN